MSIKPVTDKKILAVCRPNVHSETGASGAHRWMNCPGSVRLSRGIKSKDSIPAMEGTAAHKLGEMVLKDEVSFEDAHGQVIQVEGNGKLYDFPVDDEMCEAVRIYTDYIQSHTFAFGGYVTEMTVKIKAVPKGSGLELFGKADAGVSGPDLLKVVDYKHGKGIPVYAENNTQAMFYGFGMLQQKTEGILPYATRVELVIVQPRHKGKNLPIDSWTISAEELYRWGKEELIPAALRTEEKNAPLETGRWCRFCPAKSSCPKILAENNEAVTIMAYSLSGKNLADLLAADVSTLSSLNISSTLSRIKPLRKQMKTAEKMMAAYEEKVLKRITEKKDVPGYTVGNAASARTWKDEKSTEIILDLMLPNGGYQQSGLKTVAQIEKLLDKEGHNYTQILKNEIKSTVGKPTIIPAVKDDDVFAGYITLKPI